MAQQVHDGVIEVVGAAAANKVTQAGAIAGVLGWLAQINWIGLSGVLIAVLGLAVNFYFQHRRDKREQAESLARIEALRERCGLEGRQQ
ncbi:holin [Ectopseudomonas toyotomiensis]|uniref:Bacteriophage holin family, superfamily II-like n=1 Tax=Ectopseudomonas toyotomiensis TaxID=554344 RepID=A0A1I5R1G3_9GAMM|nr:holin [Pseudomonas toyotomiensis]PIA74291.1 holin [Pseudomonas toyotomiensis]SFP52325.1 Bacteriophage holin family, superfamily II-like [Pseudomonas toyotomiensis]